MNSNVNDSPLVNWKRHEISWYSTKAMTRCHWECVTESVSHARWWDTLETYVQTRCAFFNGSWSIGSGLEDQDPTLYPSQITWSSQGGNISISGTFFRRNKLDIYPGWNKVEKATFTGWNAISIHFGKRLGWLIATVPVVPHLPIPADGPRLAWHLEQIRLLAVKLPRQLHLGRKTIQTFFKRIFPLYTQPVNIYVQIYTIIDTYIYHISIYKCLYTNIHNYTYPHTCIHVHVYNVSFRSSQPRSYGSIAIQRATSSSSAMEAI